MRIWHLIHATTFGGVEAAAEHLRRSLGSGRGDGLGGRPGRPGGDRAPSAADAALPGGPVEYRVGALAGAPTGQEAVHADVTGNGVNSPSAALRLIRTVRSERPDVVVTSLWRTVALGPALRRVSPDTRWAIWVHLSQYTNAADRLVHERCLPRADLIVCDSDASYEAIVRPALARARTTRPVRIVRPESSPLVADGPGRAAPAHDEPLRLVFWGRMARQKRLDLVIDLACALARQRAGGVELLIAGPDDGERAALEDHAAATATPGAVISFSGPLDREDVAREASRAHAFVQLSDFEGFAMSAHEALAAGMLCVLTPVGDLAADVRDGVDAICHHGDVEDTARRVLAVTGDADAYAALQDAARGNGASTFVRDFVAACREAAAQTPGSSR